MANASNSGKSRNEHAKNLAAEMLADNEAGARTTFSPADRRTFLQGAAAAAAAAAATLAMPHWRKRVQASSTSFARKSKNATTNPSSACRIGSASRPSPPKTAA